MEHSPWHSDGPAGDDKPVPWPVLHVSRLNPMFAGELASVLGVGELGSASLDPPLRRASLESIAAATLNAAGCLVGGEWVRPPGRSY
jgi:hypothetical protein